MAMTTEPPGAARPLQKPESSGARELPDPRHILSQAQVVELQRKLAVLAKSRREAEARCGTLKFS